MMVTKQEQLEWLAKKYKIWPEQGATSLGLSVAEIGKFAIVNCHLITRREWQQERNKMNSKPEVDNSWHERGELPPVGCECRFFSDGYDENWFDWCIFHGLATCGGFIVEHHHKTSPSRVTVCLLNPRTTKFRPRCTEREKAIDEMANLISKSVFGSAKCQAEKLYDAGYRKMKP